MQLSRARSWTCVRFTNNFHHDSGYLSRVFNPRNMSSLEHTALASAPWKVTKTKGEVKQIPKYDSSPAEEWKLSQTSIEDLVYIVQKCRKERDFNQFLQVYESIKMHKIEVNQILGNSLVSTLAEFGMIGDAKNVFDTLAEQSEWSWSSLVVCCVKSGMSEDALALYMERHKYNCLHLNGHTTVALLKACSKVQDPQTGIEINAEIERQGLTNSNPFVGSTLVDMYAKCGFLHRAQEVFDNLHFRDIVSWNAIITGFAKNGKASTALQFYEQMRLEGVSPNIVTYIMSLKSCARIRALETGIEIHSEIDKKGLLQNNATIGSTLVDMYAKCGCLCNAQEVFDNIPIRDTVSWTALIAGHTEHGLNEKALECFKQMQREGVHPDIVTFVCSLRACGGLKDIEKGKEIHRMIDKKGLLGKSHILDSTLLDMYVKCESVNKGQELFDTLPVQDVNIWNALISGYVENGNSTEALSCFQKMQSKGTLPDNVTLGCILKACSNSRNIDMAKIIHVQIEVNILSEDDLSTGSALVDAYAKCGLIEKAQEVFDSLHVHDVVLWNALIMGYADNDYAQEALKHFEWMQLEGVEPDSVTFISILKACCSLKDIEGIEQLYSDIERNGILETDIAIGNTLIDSYAQCGLLSKAQKVFNELQKRDVVSWNTLIASYTHHGHGEKALDCYDEMQCQGISPNIVTFVNTLKACAHSKAVKKGQDIHAEIKKNALFNKEVIIGTSLMTMYAKCGLPNKAQEVFSGLNLRNVTIWNALLSAYEENGHNETALLFFEQMQQNGVAPNAITFISILKACRNLGDMEIGKEVHTEIARMNWLGTDLVIGNTLVDMYSKCGLVYTAQEVLDGLSVRDVISWTSLIEGYIESDHAEDAIQCFEKMQLDGIQPNSVTYICCLRACSNIGAVNKGQELHTEIEMKGLFEGDVLMSGTLVDMYSKCGMLSAAHQVLNKVPIRGPVLWNALLSGYMHSGENEKVFHTLERMLEEGVEPDSVTFLIVLSACSRGGMLYKCQLYFETMSKNYGLVPESQHHSCLVNLFSRAGELDMAMEVIKKTPLRSSLVSWHTFLGACRNWGNVDLGLDGFQNAMQLDRKDAAAYVLMSQICAMAGMQDGYKNDISVLQECK